MTEKEMLLENIKDFKKLIFDLIIRILTAYVRSLAISMAVWMLLSFLLTDGPNIVGFVTLIVTSLISSTILCRTLIKVIRHSIYSLKIIKKFMFLLDIYQSFDNIPGLKRVDIDIELNKIDRKTAILSNELSKFIEKDEKK